MAKVVIAAVGSRGDTAPLIGIGNRLQAEGHEVTLSSLPVFEELITSCGLRFLPHEAMSMAAGDVSKLGEGGQPGQGGDGVHVAEGHAAGR